MSQERSRIGTVAKGRGRKPRHRWQREQRLQKILLGVIGAAILIAILVLVVPYLKDKVWDPNQAVASVGDQTITRADYEKQVKLNSILLNSPQYLTNIFSAYESNPEQIRQGVQQQMQSAQASLSEVDPTILKQMVDDQVLVQSAGEAGVPVNDKAIDQYLHSLLKVPAASPQATATAAPTVTVKLTPQPTATAAPASPAQAKAFFSMIESTTGVSREDYKRLVLKPQYVREQYTKKNVPEYAPQVHVRHILVPTKDEAEKVLKELHSGKKFEVLAKQYSQDTSNKDKGGDLGWQPKGIFVSKFEKAAFSLDKVGDIAGPVHTQFGWHIIQLLGKDDHRKLTDQQRQTLGAKKIQDFISEQEKQMKKQDKIHTSVSIEPTPTPGT